MTPTTATTTSTTPSSSSSSSSSSSLSWYSTSSSASASGGGGSNNTTTKKESNMTYLEKKRAAKAIRTQRYKESQRRKEEKLPQRRMGKDRGICRETFRDWFVPKKVREEIANRKARQMGKEWIIEVAAIIERLPIVLPDKEKWEKDWDQLDGYLSQFGETLPKEYTQGELCEPEPIEHFTEEHLLSYLPRGFTPAPRETEADITGNVRTLDRKLKTRAYLVVRDDVYETSRSTGATTTRWQFPTVTLKLNGKENLLDAAKRAIHEKVGGSENLTLYYPSNCPIAVDIDTFSSNKQQQQQDDHKEEDLPKKENDDNYYGKKTFFLKMQYDEGSITKNNISVDDFAWLDRDEIVERIKEEQGEEKSKFYHYML